MSANRIEEDRRRKHQSPARQELIVDLLKVVLDDTPPVFLATIDLETGRHFEVAKDDLFDFGAGLASPIHRPFEQQRGVAPPPRAPVNGKNFHLLKHPQLCFFIK
jgi:hypothetical protein